MRAEAKTLDERSRGVLASVVSTYIRSATPVSSRQLTKIGRFALSSASLRNAMADLEEAGFLTHPHVSAGRVPTDLGYRTFVNELMTAAPPTAEERQQISLQLGAEPTEMGRFLQAASRVLSCLTGEVAVVAAPDSVHYILESIHFSRVSERKILVVQVTQAGLVESRLIETREDYTLPELERISRQLTEEFRGTSLQFASQKLVESLAEEKARFDVALSRALELGRLAFSAPTGGALFVEGTERILEKPEFQDLDALRRMFRAFEEKARLVRLLTDCLSEDRTAVVIGSENALTGETQSALVTTAYRRGDRVVGVLGVIGPKRMEYARVIPLVEALGTCLSQRLTEGAA